MAELELEIEAGWGEVAAGQDGRHSHAASVMSRTVRSAGLLPYRFTSHLEVLIAHPGGPWFARKDLGAWSIVKGLVEEGETDAEAARREFAEETGWEAPEDGWLSLGETRLKSRKIVVAFAVEQAFDIATFEPGLFTMHGRQYPEIDRVEWLPPDIAREKLNPAQAVFLDRLSMRVRLNELQEESK